MEDHEKMAGAARTALGKLAGHAAGVNAAEQRILHRAEARHDEINQKLAALRAKTATNPAAAAEYSALVEERGSLALVIARSRQSLGSSSA